ncbi:hypothetical protein D0T84_22480 [Dysgonomonas sp. 521]|uniref:hypothetical protein n=1 Tax=Dysgonomonas sp. 521 TaxID=2302932 RepID=UPI0013D116B9|nr:hypothetical protein [Dysgonomonas sp. 521]NDV97626.1 hypothetical protein [Dysgonomonas sp. 521]
MTKYFISIEHTQDVSSEQYMLYGPDILIRKRSFYLFSIIIKNFGTYNCDLERYASRYCRMLNTYSS